MTAIFAHVNGNRALVAADTLRVDPLGWFAPQTVTKVFSFANCIVFAGAGNGPRLERLAQAVVAEEGSSTPDEAGFLAAFQNHQAVHYAAATSGNSVFTSVPELSQGTYLVAVPALSGAPAHLFELDFATGARTDLASHTWAQGTDPPAFQAISQLVLAGYTSTTGFPGDLWAGECLSRAVKLYPQAVGFPFDVAIAAPSPTGRFSVRMARHAAAPHAGDQAFQL